jgi:hypothetical protein
MKLIIIEGSAYSVTEKEFLRIKKLEDKIKEPNVIADYKLYFHYEDILANYLDENKKRYKYIDEIWFHYQR